MSDADLFRRYAKEAVQRSSKATSNSEKRALSDLAYTWAQAALMSDTSPLSRIFRIFRLGRGTHSHIGVIVVCDGFSKLLKIIVAHGG
jgi:hypothetical protein